MREGEVDSGECLEKGDFFFHVQISSFSLEEFARPHLDHDDDITRLDIGDAVSLTVDGELLSAGGTLIDFHLELLAVSLYLLSLADLASLLHVDHLALTVAVVAGTSTLGVHPGAHHAHCGLLASSLAA